MGSFKAPSRTRRERARLEPWGPKFEAPGVGLLGGGLYKGRASQEPIGWTKRYGVRRVFCPGNRLSHRLRDIRIRVENLGARNVAEISEPWPPNGKRGRAPWASILFRRGEYRRVRPLRAS